jgi:hypothetical protein
MLLTSAQAPPSIQYCSPTLKGPAGAPYSELVQSISTERTIWTINMPPSLEEGTSNTGIQGHVLQQMSTQPVLQEDEISPIDQAETSRHASNHDKINWLLAEFPLDETTASITTVLALIAVAIKLHHLRTIVICLNTTNLAKAHPIKHRIRHLKDVEEWYSGGTIIKNTRHSGGGIEKQTRVIIIHKELDPITAAMATKENHPSPATISEGLDTRPDIIDDYDWPRANEQRHIYRPLSGIATCYLETMT